MKILNLSNRLQAIADFVTIGTAVIDVGTDHGYIPIFLAQHGYSGKIYASDINEGPLSRAKQFAADYGVADKIQFYLANGLDFTDGKNIDTVIIAGMGGENIVDILEKAAWTHNKVHLILQPQSKLADLANWLDNNGFAIHNVILVKDAGKIYPVLSVFAGKSRAPFSCAEMYADRILMENKDPLLPEYLNNLIKKLQRELEGKSKGKKVKVDELCRLKFAIIGFYKMLEETRKW